LKILIWCTRQGLNVNLETCRAAAYRNQLEVLVWLLEVKKIPYCMEILVDAARSGHLDVLQYLHNNKYADPGQPNPNQAIVAAVSSGNQDVVEWLMIRYGGYAKLLKPKAQEIVLRAITSRNLTLTKWLINKGFELDRNLGCHFVSDLESLIWLKQEQNCYWDATVCTNAAKAQSFDMLKWARAHGCPWDKNTTDECVRSGNLEMLVWAVDNGCPIDFGECAKSAASSRNLEILKWLHERGDIWNQIKFEVVLIGSGNLKIVQWAHSLQKTDFKKGTGQNMTTAVRRGNLALVKWLHEIGCSWDFGAVYTAILQRHVLIVRFCVDHGCPLAFFQSAAMKKFYQNNALPWLKSNLCDDIIEKLSPVFSYS
jgi:hypothetical protein